MNIIGKRIKKLREEKKLSQLELAKFLNIANSTLSLYESGKREVDNKMLEKIANFFDCSIDYLFGRTDNPTPPTNRKKTTVIEYVLSAETLADATLRIAEKYNDYEIDDDDFLKLSKLAYKKHGLPLAPGSERAAHLKRNTPGSGVFEGDDNKNKDKS